MLHGLRNTDAGPEPDGYAGPEYLFEPDGPGDAHGSTDDFLEPDGRSDAYGTADDLHEPNARSDAYGTADGSAKFLTDAGTQLLRRYSGRRHLL